MMEKSERELRTRCGAGLCAFIVLTQPCPREQTNKGRQFSDSVWETNKCVKIRGKERGYSPKGDCQGHKATTCEVKDRWSDAEILGEVR
ncbi:hypothetical protein BDV06DRAFT_165485 [Aspergillus oleicola]